MSSSINEQESGAPRASDRSRDGYRIQVDDGHHDIADPKPTGRQLLSLTKQRPVDEHLIYMVLPSGGFEELQLNETVDLRARSIERFITFDSSASYRLVVDGDRFEWGSPLVSGHKLKEFVGADTGTYDLWREVRGGEDEPVANNDIVDLREEGLERFFTAIKETTAGEGIAFLPSRDRSYLIDHNMPFDEVDQSNIRGIVIKKLQYARSRLERIRGGPTDHPSTRVSRCSSGHVLLLSMASCGSTQRIPKSS